MECREALAWEWDVVERKKWDERELLLAHSIDDSLPELIVQKRKDRRGQLVWPWQR